MLAVAGDYRESDSSALVVTVQRDSAKGLQVDGRAVLAGTLAVNTDGPLKAGQRFAILSAQEVLGHFANPGNQVIASDGTVITIHYSASKVELIVADLMRVTVAH